MKNWDAFDVQVGSAFPLEPEILDKFMRLASASNSNLGYRRKEGLAGPNDLIYLIGNLNFWTDVLPFAGKSVASGILAGAGKAIWDAIIKGRRDGQLGEVDNRRLRMISALDDCVVEIKNHEKYWTEGSNVRFALPTTTRQARDDVGYTVKDPDRDPSMAIMALNVIGPEVCKMVDEVRRDYIQANEFDSPQVTGDISCDKNGTVRAFINVNGVPTEIIKKIDTSA